MEEEKETTREICYLIDIIPRTILCDSIIPLLMRRDVRKLRVVCRYLCAMIHGPLNYKDDSPLFVSCLMNHITIVDLLLENGANPNVTCKTDKSTPLLIACKNEHIEVVSLLLYHGANPNFFYNGITPLLIACDKESEEITMLLVQYGAKLLI